MTFRAVDHPRPAIRKTRNNLSMITSLMTTDPDKSRQDEQLAGSHEPSAKDSNGSRENLLLFSGVGLVLLAVAMALSNIFA